MKKTVFMAAMAIFALSSCSNNENEGLTPNNPKTITFSTYTAKQSKGVAVTNATFDTFSVYGYQGATAATWATAPTILMNGVTVNRAAGSADNSWISEPPVLWPNEGEHVAFYGYAPVSAKIDYSAAAPNGPQLVYTTDPVAVNQVDLIVAESGDITAAASGANNRVPMSFTHALAQVGFKAQVPAGWTAYINSIEIEGLKTVGTYTFNTDAWSSLGTIANVGIGLDATVAQGLTISPYANITATDGYMMVLPQSITAWDLTASNPSKQGRLKIVYSLKHDSENKFYVGTSEIAYATAYLPFGINLERGKAYSINLNFGDSSSNSGGGGYYDNGTPILPKGNYILFSTTFTEWVNVDYSASM